jgi:nucleoside-diphosphate-sugar epimerase
LKTNPKTLLIGCGYIGLPLALELRGRGDSVTPWVHSEQGSRGPRNLDFAEMIIGSVADERTWNEVCRNYDLVIHCASSGRGGEEAFAEVFREGMRQIIAHQPKARKIFVSSTSVYGQTSGEPVSEVAPAEPFTPTGKILREAEAIALEGGATVVRSSGIYGPGRAVLWEKFKRGEAVIEGDGLRWINQIHQRDLVAALAHLIDAGAPGEIYNATDDTPVSYRDYYAWCSEFLSQPMPPHGPISTERKRGLTNKRVSNTKLRATGWQPMYPSFREGLTADHSPK